MRTRNVAVEYVVEFKRTGKREVVGLTESECIRWVRQRTCALDSADMCKMTIYNDWIRISAHFIKP